MPNSNPHKKANRFVVISGIELVVDKIKGRTVTSLYNAKIKRLSKHTL